MEKSSNNHLNPDKKEIVDNNQDIKNQNSKIQEENENNEDNEQILFFKQKIEKILREYVRVFEVDKKKEIDEKERNEDKMKKFFPEFIFVITKKDSFEQLKRMKDHLNHSGFQLTLSIIEKKDAKVYANRKEISDYIDSAEKMDYGNNSIINDDRIDKYSLFIIKFNPISPLFYQRMQKKSRNNILNRKKINLNLKHLSLSLLSLVGLALFILFQVKILIDQSNFTSSFWNSFGTSEEKTEIINILYFVLGFVSIILVREITYLITSKIRDVKYDTTHFAGLEDLSVKKLNPNNMFDLAASRILSGFLCSLLLLIMGFVLSEQIPTSLLIFNNTGDHINRYNLLTQLLKYLFFPGRNNFIEISYYDSTFLLPKYTILMHPLAYAGHLGLLLTLFSISPIQHTDGGKIYYAIFRDRYGHWVGSALIAVITVTLTFSSEYALSIIPAICLIVGIKKHDSIYQIEDLKFNLYPLSNGRRKSLILFVIIIILIFPISMLTDFYGYLY